MTVNNCKKVYVTWPLAFFDFQNLDETVFVVENIFDVFLPELGFDGSPAEHPELSVIEMLFFELKQKADARREKAATLLNQVLHHNALGSDLQK